MSKGRWHGRTVACIASGPSLHPADCELIRLSGMPTIAVNNSWQMARFASVIYAGDPGWWDAYGAEIDIGAERWNCMENVAKYRGLNWFPARGPHNSGMRAIELAIEFGAARVILLGYDCSVENGIHWHADHDKIVRGNPIKNPDADRCAMWLTQFAMMDRKGADIVNCSRETALKCFRRERLGDLLCAP
jgi:hypothetical protein